jgi:homoserine kinase
MTETDKVYHMGHICPIIGIIPGLNQMSDEWIKVAAPATTSNIGPGFDTFGLALSEPYDIVEGRKIDSGMIISEITGPGSDIIPIDPKKNSVCIAAAEVLQKSGEDFGIEFRITKGIRPGSGLGSSGASASGGAYLAHLMCGKKLTDNELVLCAARAESVTSGGLHADNVAPSLLGGFTVIRSYDPFDVISIEPPKNLGIVVTLPDIYIETKEARKVIPKEVPLEHLVFHVGNASCLTHGMATGDLDLIKRSIRDLVSEPNRKELVPRLDEAEETALSNGALASFLGGSGPCVMSFYDKSTGDGNVIAEKVKSVYTQAGIGCESWVTVCGKGCRRI